MGFDYDKKFPAVEHKEGMAKPGFPLKEIKEKLDSVARQLSSYGARDLSGEKFWTLRKQWEWLNTTKVELNKEAERELFCVPRSDVRGDFIISHRMFSSISLFGRISLLF